MKTANEKINLIIIKMTKFIETISTPIGNMEIIASKQAILSVLFVEGAISDKPNKLTDLAKKQLFEYFSGQRQYFDLPLQAQGTNFQKSVWQALLGIEYAHTCSYQDIANTINNSKAVRAVGSANGKNPLTIIVPCHRVIGADGSLTGYASGVDRKAWLLKHELQYNSATHNK